jgi:uncharacterized protein (DUF362 family)
VVCMANIGCNSVGFATAHSSASIDTKNAIQQSLDLIHFKFPKEVQNIVIKPNMCYYWDHTTGYTTDPRFIGILIDLLRERISNKISISIVESDASAMKCKHAFPILGYERLATQYNVKLVNLTEDKADHVGVRVKHKDFDLLLPHTIRDADLRINVPKIKYMNPVKITCAMKNVFGCNPSPLKYKFHPYLDEIIVALNKIMKFHLSILDGILLLGAFTRKLNMVMASQDPVAFDSAAAQIAGVNPYKVEYLTLARNEGLGQIRYKSYGVDRRVFERQFPRRKLAERFWSTGYDMAVKSGLVKAV